MILGLVLTTKSEKSVQVNLAEYAGGMILVQKRVPPTIIDDADESSLFTLPFSVLSSNDTTKYVLNTSWTETSMFAERLLTAVLSTSPEAIILH